MAEPTSSIRHVVKAAFVKALKEKLRGVQVSYGWPGEELEAESLYFAGCEGTTAVPTSKSGRRSRQDDFTLSCVIQAGLAGDDMEATEKRAAVFLAALDDVFADDATLGNLPGLQDIGMTVRVDGPNSYLTPQGAVTMYFVEIAISSRYQ